MSIKSEFDKLSNAKTKIRKVLQRKKTDLSLQTNFTDYYNYIRSMSDTRNPDESNILDYIEDRLSYLEIRVDKIRPYAFRSYTCLKGLYLNNSQKVTLENKNAFYGIHPIIYVPSALLSQYQSDPIWSSSGLQIQVYSAQVAEQMYLLQHIDYVQTLAWLSEKTVGEIIKDFR